MQIGEKVNFGSNYTWALMLQRKFTLEQRKFTLDWMLYILSV